MLRSAPWPHSLVSKQRETKKTLDNHRCLQYRSSKRLKAHIAYNWIWFALPASVREIKGKHKNPHDSFSSRWQARPNRSWKEYLWRKPSHLLAEAGGNDCPGEQWAHSKNLDYYGCLRMHLMFLPTSKWEVKVEFLNNFKTYKVE